MHKIEVIVHVGVQPELFKSTERDGASITRPVFAQNVGKSTSHSRKVSVHMARSHAVLPGRPIPGCV
jgi:hypothetical protein